MCIIKRLVNNRQILVIKASIKYVDILRDCDV